MKKIAILSCLDACQVCTGAACFQAWNEKSRHFSCYASEDVSFVAFFHCNGCGKDPIEDKGMRCALRCRKCTFILTLIAGS